MQYEEFFQQCTGFAPRSFQLEIGLNELQEEINAPTGAGKTAAILVKYLWELQYGENPQRKLLFILPMRALTTQVSMNVQQLITKAAPLLKEKTPQLYTLMGGDFDSSFLLTSHTPSIIIGVADIAVNMLVGTYGNAKIRDIYTGFFAHDTWIVLDETQLVPYAAASIKHLSKIMNNVETASGKPNFYTLMSATGTKKYEGEITDLHSNKKYFSIQKEKDAIQQIIRAQGKRIIVVNRVLRAQQIAEEIIEQVDKTVKVLCLHSRFTENDKQQILQDYSKHTNVILISTQVIEAGVDITSDLMVSDCAPVESLVQRAGRLGRCGEENTEFIMIQLPKFQNAQEARSKTLPYTYNDLEKAQSFLEEIESPITAAELCQNAPITPLPNTNPNAFYHVMNKNISSYNTECEFKYDEAVFVRDAPEMKITLIWSDKETPPDQRLAVRINKTAEVLKSSSLLKWDGDHWAPANDDINYKTTYRIPYTHWGYSDLLGFTDNEINKRASIEKVLDKKLKNKNQILNHRTYEKITKCHEVIELQRHLDDTRDEAEKITDSWLKRQTASIIICAAHLHDVGKESTQWQHYIRSRSNVELPSDLLLAKSYTSYNDNIVIKHNNINQIKQESTLVDAGPRHEYIGGLMVSSRRNELLSSLPQESWPLCIWLIYAHHGNIKFSAPPVKEATARSVSKMLNIPVDSFERFLNSYVKDASRIALLAEGKKIEVTQLPFMRNIVVTPQVKYDTPKDLLDVLRCLNVDSLENKLYLLQLSAAVRCADWAASNRYE